MIGSEANILIVDDDEVDVMAIKRALRNVEIANPVYVARDGVEALEKLRSKEISSPYIILMDLNMPRMNGIDCMKEIRNDKNLRRSVIFVLTTSEDDEDKAKAYEYNAAGYIVKSGIKNGFVRAMEMLGNYFKVVELPSY